MSTMPNDTESSHGPTPAHHGDGVKDTIESLVVAFILAFVFRGFLVEAFVIPTGSMAPTLYGMHGTQMCPDCGFEYAYGMRQGGERNQIKCPNCEWENQTHTEIPYHARGICPLSPGRRRARSNLHETELARLEQMDFNPQSGDRILVFKWPFDIGGERLGPQPWDVVVFKNPSDGENNYIKRLIGVPNEVLQIIDGDVYTCPVSELPEDLVADMEDHVALKHEIFCSNKRSRKQRFKNAYKVLNKRLAPYLRIRRKTDVAQKSLWHPVFHQDYLPVQTRQNIPHWKVLDENGAWDTSEPVIRFDGLGQDAQTIRFSGKRIVDYYAYNYGSGSPAEKKLHDVGDLRLKMVLQMHEGQGHVEFELMRTDTVFRLRLMPDGGVALSQRTGRGFKVIKGAEVTPWLSDRMRAVNFEVVDYQVRLTIDDQVVLFTTPEEYAPDVNLLGKPRRGRAGARITAEDMVLDIHHLQLDRDVYYRSVPGDWGVQDKPILLREGEYFVLGDNSPESQDSRLWETVGPHLQERGAQYQLGTVSEDQLIGKAFFVYWPSGYRIHSLPVAKSFGIIPNVGKMRWIR